MEKIYCKYHRQTPARWMCPSCKTHFCQQCAKPPAKGAADWLCPLCRGGLAGIGIGNAIPPFWERIPQFFLYPAKFDNLVHISLLSLASLATFLPFVGLLVPVLVFLALMKYAYVLLEHTALGNMDPPTTGLATHNGSPYKQYVIFLLMFVVVGIVTALLGRFAGILAYAAVVFAIPASVMVLAMSGSLLFAVNPANVLRLITGVGWPYCLLYFFLLLLSSGSGMLTGFLLPVLPLAASLVVLTFTFCYFTLIMFHMMGYVVYQYHEELGLEGVKEYQVKPAKPEPKVDELTAEINILISEGRFDEAKTRLKKELRHSGNSEHFSRYHKLLLLGDDTQELARHGQEYISLLLAKGQANNALSVFAECLARVPGFTVETGAQAFELAQTAMRQHRLLDAALGLLTGFAQRYPRNKNIPAAGLLEAKLLCEHKLDDERAKALLEGLLRDYPEHELAGEIQQYLQLMGRLQSFNKIPPSR